MRNEENAYVENAQAEEFAETGGKKQEGAYSERVC